MPTYQVVTPDDPEFGIRVSCQEHAEQMEFERGKRRGAFYCSICDVEVEVAVYDKSDWRELTERC